MMKKIVSILLTAVMSLSILAGCSSNNEASVVRVASLKGPTSIGLLKLMDDSSKGEANNSYEFTMATTADEVLPKMISGELDIALVPANVAAVLYNKTEGKVKVIDINTLGVLYAVSGDNSVSKVSDLRGKTIYITNMGTTPDYVTQLLLAANGIALDEVTIEYKSEATEVAATLKEHPEAVGILPQPFVTAACIQNQELSPVLDLTAEWDAAVKDGSRLVTGVTVARTDFIDGNKKAIAAFLEEHKASCEYVSSDVEGCASLVVSSGIIEKEPVALKAIPKCNVTYIDGDDMKAALSGYLKALFDMDATTVGGKLPDENFYY